MNPNEYKKEVEAAKNEIDAINVVTKATIVTIGSKEQNSFFDFLRTERTQESIRNLGYIDTKGKTKLEIKEEIETKYGELFESNGKKLEINFYTNAEVSENDPKGKDKKSSAGFVAENGSIWLN